MRIALLGPVYPFRGGIAHHTTLLARAIASNHELLTVSFRSQYPRLLYPGRTDRDNSTFPTIIPAEYLLHPLLPWTWWQTADRIARFVPNVVVVQWWTTFWSLADWALVSRLRARDIKVLFLIHNVLPHEPRLLDTVLAASALRLGSAFIAQSNREQRRLLSLLPAARVSVCPMPVFTNFRSTNLTKAEARQRLCLPVDRPLVLYFGIVRPYKGLRYLVQAVAELRREAIEVNLVVAGEFWEDLASYRHDMREWGIEDLVFIHNRYILDENVPQYFAAADVFVAPYVEATQSAALQTAKAFGLPLVITDVLLDAGIKWNDGQATIVVGARDPKALAAGIRQSLHSNHDPNARQPSSPDSASGWAALAATIEKSITTL